MVNFKVNLKTKTHEIEPYLSIDGIEIDINNLQPGSINLEQYRKARANTPGFRLLYSKLNDEALAEAVRHNLANCTHPFSPAVYEYALQNYLVPELIKRLEGYSSGKTI